MTCFVPFRFICSLFLSLNISIHNSVCSEVGGCTFACSLTVSNINEVSIDPLLLDTLEFGDCSSAVLTLTPSSTSLLPFLSAFSFSVFEREQY